MDEQQNMWDYSPFWKEALSQLKQEIGEQEFNMWFNLEYQFSQEHSIHVFAPSAFYKDQVTHRYLHIIENKLQELSGRALALQISIHAKAKNSYAPSVLQTQTNIKTEIIPQKNEATPNKSKLLKLRSDYLFSTFVVGENNSFAANAAHAIAKNPGTTYNPFLIYGGVGLGKTHLMQAIGNQISEEKERIKVICITAEEFTNEFIQSIQDKAPNAFKNKYRHVDVLLIDDIHFLQNKLGSQEELFHTFNALYDANKQMVFTCDRPVSELKNLSDRLRSRFERGLNVDLQPPNYETRVAILKMKIENRNLKIGLDIIEIIAKNISTNVRDIEAALTRLEAYSNLVNRDITIEIAQQQLKDMFSNVKQGNITVETIQKLVAEYFNLSLIDIKGKKKTKNIAFPRQIAMHITRELTELSTTEIGMEFGGRDHTTVMHACQKIEDLKKSDPTLESTMQKLIRMIKEYSTKS